MIRAGQPGSVSVTARPAGGAQDGEARPWALAEEVPVGVLLNSVPVAVMMATPMDLEEFGAGFLIAEGHLRAGDITAALVFPTDRGFCVDIAAPGVDPPPARRALEGRAGCGLCGMEALTDLSLDLPHRSRPRPDPDRVAAGFELLDRHQPLRAVNRSVHAAGFIAEDGTMPAAREDVGRHCALDKLTGALALRRIDPAGGVAIMTSRCSFELVRKAALAGFGGLATRSAPTGLAVELAARAGLPLFARQGAGVVAFGA
ncbi:formate dehydrogenase accessory sulfurtransferase FdhD [Palleronia sediminis]|uniref:formate dehydrogenase accessory sulfurtransferase FdhD n=1 Tax=Palleronia sediminis TaxID=2547833 RepID=UPI00145510BD|nr:formate dehydrogenase accessory sulfurtransferase FdhD [Palleronia sediminis]